MRLSYQLQDTLRGLTILACYYGDCALGVPNHCSDVVFLGSLATRISYYSLEHYVMPGADLGFEVGGCG